MSSVLLRSQSLLSSARFMNFDPSNPVEAAENQTVDVNYTIIILLGCIFTPFAVALKLHHILLACFAQLKMLLMKWKQDRHLFTDTLSATTRNVDLQIESQAVSLSEDMSPANFTATVSDAPYKTPKSSCGSHVCSEQAPQYLANGTVPESFSVEFTASPLGVSAREVVTHIASDALLSEDVSAALSVTKLDLTNAIQEQVSFYVFSGQFLSAT
jgi:hypothetical protein